MKKLFFSLFASVILLIFINCEKTEPEPWEIMEEHYDMVDFGFEQYELLKLIGFQSAQTDTSVKFITPPSYKVEFGQNGYYSKEPLWPDKEISIQSHLKVDDQNYVFWGYKNDSDTLFVATHDQNNDIVDFTTIPYIGRIEKYTMIGDHYYFCVYNSTGSTIFKIDKSGVIPDSLSIDVKVKHMYKYTDTSLYITYEEKGTCEFSVHGDIIWKADVDELDNVTHKHIDIDNNQILFFTPIYTSTDERLNIIDLKGKLIKSTSLYLGPYVFSWKIIHHLIDGYVMSGVFYSIGDHPNPVHVPEYFFLIELDEDYNVMKQYAQKIDEPVGPYSAIRALHQINPNTYFIALFNTFGWHSYPILQTK